MTVNDIVSSSFASTHNPVDALQGTDAGDPGASWAAVFAAPGAPGFH